MPLNPNNRPEQGQSHPETSKVYVELYLRRGGLWVTKSLHLQSAHHHGCLPFDGCRANVSPAMDGLIPWSGRDLGEKNFPGGENIFHPESLDI